jgi:pullulanase/glycogen debranching enzyme
MQGSRSSSRRLHHTAEGNEVGPILSFKGIDNASYYMLIPGPPTASTLSNDHGTGGGEVVVVQDAVDYIEQKKAKNAP